MYVQQSYRQNCDKDYSVSIKKCVKKLRQEEEFKQILILNPLLPLLCKICHNKSRIRIRNYVIEVLVNAMHSGRSLYIGI